MTGRTHPRLLGVGLVSVGGLLLAACSLSSPQPSPPAGTSPAPTPVASSRMTSPVSPSFAEPTTTNTLPPPPPPSEPAPSTAGELSAGSLPVPRGWRTAVLDGGEEEGFLGNGTWVHARDPRYAAQDVITLGCSPVTRDDYADPVAALEGNYRNSSGAPGVGLALQFADEQAADNYFELYRRQVTACSTGEPVRITIETDVGGLVDRRTYPDSEWTEIAERNGRRITLIILSDPGHNLSKAAAQRILDQIG